MLEHRFGGQWTQEKLERIRKYLPAYTTIFHANEKARFLKTVYVDAFAGTGYSIPRSTAKEVPDSDLFPELREAEVQGFLKGSAQIALETNPPFDQYIFVEKEEKYAQELERLRVTYYNSELSIRVVQSDARSFLFDWCQKQDWNKTRAVIFLDPYSSEVDWATLNVVAKGKVDLWLLWPIGQVINRLLTTQSLPIESWGNALTRAFGTDAWKDQFYAPPVQSQLGLFSDENDTLPERMVKIADFKQIEQFFIERLKTLFPFVAENPLYLYNSQNTPLYLLCFASHDPTAVKIAQDILKP